MTRRADHPTEVIRLKRQRSTLQHTRNTNFDHGTPKTHP